MSTGADTHDSLQRRREDGAAPACCEQPGVVVRLLPISVLVLSRDRYFRSAATMLLSRRGCSVLSASEEREAHDHALLEIVDVLVVELEPPAGEHLRRARAIAAYVDRASVTVGRRVAPVGIVVVGEQDELGATLDADRASPFPVLDKWGPFERLFQAIADRDRARRLPSSADAEPGPRAAPSHGAG